MPSWCHMFNSTLTGNARVWFDDLPAESIDSYDDLRKAFLKNDLQQKKCIKDHIEIYNIKQREGESTEDFVKRYKLESRDVKRALECMRIFGFVHGIANPELIKCLHDKIPKTVDEMIRVTTSFLRGEVAASNHERKKSFPPWKQQEGTQRQNFKKGGFQNQQRPERKQDRFTLLSSATNDDFGRETESHQILKNAQGMKSFAPNKGAQTEQWKGTAQDGEERRNLWERQSISHTNDEDEGIEGPMIIEAEIGGHYIHRMYVDGGSASEILSPSPYNGIIGRPGVRKLQAVPSTAHRMLKLPVKGGVITLKGSRQKKRGQSADRNKAIQEKVGKLVEA
ncbi:reverse transcriptase domain-containing protein [Tanacetum coccineum]